MLVICRFCSGIFFTSKLRQFRQNDHVMNLRKDEATDKLLALTLIAAAGVVRVCINIKHRLSEFYSFKID